MEKSKRSVGQSDEEFEERMDFKQKIEIRRNV
jgi:hypothetical protein